MKASEDQLRGVALAVRALLDALAAIPAQERQLVWSYQRAIVDYGIDAQAPGYSVKVPDAPGLRLVKP